MRRPKRKQNFACKTGRKIQQSSPQNTDDIFRDIDLNLSKLNNQHRIQRPKR